ncbi:MAG: YifB family Mg chelatase-like AAA ATPase [Paludibacteraceae bacterium]|nr:YifB family Mg chelatase-like AAA ATPase [Paludibacteraceae bacterium]
MLIKTFSAALQGIDAALITIEMHAVAGVDFVMVGLPDNAVKESRERIHAALIVNGFDLPHKQLTVNLAPADMKKEGSAFDLPLAIGMLAISEEVKADLLSDYLMVGELSLDGTLQAVHGVLPIALCAKKQGFKHLIVPEANWREAAVVDGIEVFGASSLLQVVQFLNGLIKAEDCLSAECNKDEDVPESDIDFSDVRGQENVRRAMEVAAAGGHNMLMVGPPGAGKSMMAKRLPSILPPLNMDEAVETTKIHSVAGILRHGCSLVHERPFRSPHHTITEVALIGGGTNPKPGEISLAHNGVLFLDELPEYKRQTLEVLRQPLEDRHITVSRNKLTVDYPASFMLVAAMNPCPCGHYGDPTHVCTCTPAQVHKYKDKISGPLLDRIDIQCEIQAVPYSKLKEMKPGESSAAIRQRVVQAREIQSKRFMGTGIYCNAMMSPKMVRQYCAIDEQGDKLLSLFMDKLGLSARAYDRILKVARTIADLAESEAILPAHLMEAISYRSLDRDSWGD